MTSRRKFLIGLSLTGIGMATYGYFRGLRIPPLVWEPDALPKQVDQLGSTIKFEGLIAVQDNAPPADRVQLRAHVPEPQIAVNLTTNDTFIIEVINIAPEANLELAEGSGASVLEKTNGITRTLEIRPDGSPSILLKWKLPTEEYQSYRFAAIGDTGGADELQWCIQRAHELGAKFLLHLGDFNYQEGDYENTVKLLNQAPIPCYVAIGNHDFHQSGPIYSTFLDQIGPLNSTFSIGNTRFINIDTAARILPSGAGGRGRLFEELKADPKSYTSNIGFTHRPLFDPDEERNHDIGSPNEREWLIQSLLENDVKTLLSGHIHIYARATVRGIDNIVAGQGLGHQDLITNSDYSKMAIGEVNNLGKVTMTTAPLSMPMAIHCHPRSDVVKESLIDSPHADVIDKISRQCSERYAESAKKPYPGY